MTPPTSMHQRAKQLLEQRFLRRARDPGAERQIHEHLEAKMDKIKDRRDAYVEKLRELLKQAKALWANRVNLKPKHVLYLAAALLYFISPVDAVPDPVPVLGYVDDLLILSWTVAMIISALRAVKDQALDQMADRLVSKGQKALNELFDQKSDQLFAQIDQAADEMVQKSVTTVVVSLWGVTTAAAISLAATAVYGGYSLEWTVYILVASGLIVAWNIGHAIAYMRQFRELEGKWQKRILALVAAKLMTRHIVAIGVPVVVLIGLGVARVLLNYF